MTSRPGTGATFRVPSQDPGAAGCTEFACEVWGVVTEPGFITAAVIAGLAVFVAFAYVRDAKECCREERRRVVDERDAFEEFADRVAALDATPADATTGFDGPVVGVQRGSGFASPGDVRLRRVVDAYRDTVLSLPHYQEEYGDTLTESLAAELGPDATRTLTGGGTLSPEVQSALVTRSEHAASTRSTLADAIDTELDALEDAEARLTEIDRSHDRLIEHLEGVPAGAMTGAEIDVWHRLGDLEARCDDAVSDRQERIRDPPMTVDFAIGDGSPSFYQYLYGPLEGTSFPVLAEFTELANRIGTDRDRLVTRIANGH